MFIHRNGVELLPKFVASCLWFPKKRVAPLRFRPDCLRLSANGRAALMVSVHAEHQRPTICERVRLWADMSRRKPATAGRG